MAYQALLFCSDEKTARVVEKILGELEFTVSACGEPFAAVKRIATEHFDALVVDCRNEQDAALLFKSARNSASNHSSLSVALVEGQAGIAKAFRIGANLVLSKPINVEQSKATLRVARGLLRKAEAAKPQAGDSFAGSPSFADDPEPFAPFHSAGSSNQPLPPPSTAALPTPPTMAAGLEVEADDEPVPALGAAEAALIESMPEPRLASQDKPGATNAPSWFKPPQPRAPSSAKPPVVEPALESIASATPVNGVFTPELGDVDSVDASDEVTAPQDILASASRLSRESAAAATAPAKQTLETMTESDEMETTPSRSEAVPPPTAKKSGGKPAKKLARTRSTSTLRLDIEGNAEPPYQESGNKRNLLMAALLVVCLAAAGYLSWPRLEPVIMKLGIVQKYLGVQPQAAPRPAPAPAPAAVPAPIPGPVPATDSSAPLPGAPAPQPPAASAAPTSQQQATPAESTPAPAQHPQPSAPTPAAPKPAQQTAVPETSPQAAAPHSPSVARVRPLLMVKSDIKKGAQLRQAATPAPPAPLEIAATSADKSLAGVVTAPTTAPRPQVLHVSQGVSNGLLIRQIQPVYPQLAIQMRVEGAVVLDATITKDGSVSDLKLVKGDPMLVRAAVDAVRRWKYKPYYLNGEPIELQTQITINFKLPM